MTVMEIKSRISSRLGIESLLPMQEEMATVKLSSRVLLCAPTGSGKTLAFTIALLRSLDKQVDGTVAALVIAPSRELVIQIKDIIGLLAAPEYKTTAVYGGHSLGFSTGDITLPSSFSKQHSV